MLRIETNMKKTITVFSSTHLLIFFYYIYIYILLPINWNDIPMGEQLYPTICNSSVHKIDLKYGPVAWVIEQPTCIEICKQAQGHITLKSANEHKPLTSIL